jgi:hypothetical protein
MYYEALVEAFFKESPTINKQKKSEEVIDLTPPPALHSTWDVNNDGANDCEDEGICDLKPSLSPARTRFKEITNWAKIGFC